MLKKLPRRGNRVAVVLDISPRASKERSAKVHATLRKLGRRYGSVFKKLGD